MNKRILDKLQEFKKIAANHKEQSTPNRLYFNRPDSLTTVIRSKKEAAAFMDEVESTFKRAK